MRNEIEQVYPSWQKVSLTKMGYIAQREKAVSQILSLLEGIVPPEKQTTNAECKWPDHPNNIKCYTNHIPPIEAQELPENIGYNQCRADILDNLKEKGER